MPVERFLHVLLGPRRLLLPIDAVATIHELGETTSVPGAPATVAGLADLRGRIVTLIDAGVLVGRPAASGGSDYAIQLADPLGHLALRVEVGPNGLQTDPEGGVSWEPAVPGEGGAEPVDPELGREVRLEDGRVGLRVDPQGLVQHAIRKVRDRFRVAR